MQHEPQQGVGPMMQHTHDDLWRDFPKTAIEFEERFATEEDCRTYWIQARWSGKPACARCKSPRVDRARWLPVRMCRLWGVCHAMLQSFLCMGFTRGILSMQRRCVSAL